ncbi:MAG: hypothetical protein QXI12_13265 [Candidatus Methanomethyliaceae archaeon]
MRCGLVLGPVLSFLPNRENDGDSTLRRAIDLATSARRHDRNLGTEIYNLPDGIKISPRTRQWWYRVKKRLEIRSARERRLTEFLCNIEKVCSYMGLPRGVRDDLCYAAQRLVGRSQGSSHLRTLFIMTYLACRRHHADREIGKIDLAFRELFGSDYVKVRDPKLDRARDIGELSDFTQARVQELGRVLGY